MSGIDFRTGEVWLRHGQDVGLARVAANILMQAAIEVRDATMSIEAKRQLLRGVASIANPDLFTPPFIGDVPSYADDFANTSIGLTLEED